MIQSLLHCGYGISPNEGGQYLGFVGWGDPAFAFTFGSGLMRFPVSASGTFRNFRVLFHDPHPALTVTFVKNGIGTGLLIDVGTDETTGENTGTEVAVTAGLDDVCIRVNVGTTAAGSAYDMGWSVEFESDEGLQVYGVGGAGGTVQVGAGFFGGILGNGILQSYSSPGPPTFPSNTYSLNAVPGVLERLDVLAWSGAPGTDSWTGWIVVNGVKQDGTGGTIDTTCVVTGTDDRAFSTFSLPIAIQDYIEVQIERGGSVASFSSLHVGAGVAFRPTDAKSFMICGGSNSQIGDVTAYRWVESEQAAVGEARALAPVPLSGLEAYALYVNQGTAQPTGGFVYTLRQNGAPTPLTFTITGATAVDGSVIALPFPYVAGDTMSLEYAPFDDADGDQLHWSIALQPPTDSIPGDVGGVIGPLLWITIPFRPPVV